MSTVSNSVNSVNSLISVNHVNSVNSVNSYSAVLPPSPMVFFLYLLKLHKGVAGQFFSAGVIELTHFSPTVFLTARKTDPLKIPP